MMKPDTTVMAWRRRRRQIVLFPSRAREMVQMNVRRGRLTKITRGRDIFPVNAKPSIAVNSRPARSKAKWSLIAFSRQESLPCVLRPAEHRAIRASEEKAVGMSLVEKREQVARFAEVM